MNVIKTITGIAAVAGLALSISSANAATVNLDGVLFPTGEAQADGSMRINLPQPLVNTGNPADFATINFANAEIFGQVSHISPNGTVPFTWTNTGTPDLTYALSGLSLSAPPALDSTIFGDFIVVSLSGDVTYYVDNGTLFDENNIATAIDGNDVLTASFTEELFVLNLTNGVISATGNVDFTINGGDWADNFEEEFFTFSMASEEVGTPAEVAAALYAGYTVTGSTDTRFNIIPEPAALGLFGLGLVGLGALSRRRRQAA